MEWITPCAIKRMTKCVSLWVCVYFPRCLIHHVQLKPVNQHRSTPPPQTRRKINLENKKVFPLPPGPSHSPLTRVGSGPGSTRTSSSLHSGNRSTCPKSQPMPLTACDGAENIFPSLWLWRISQRINQTTKERKKVVWVEKRVCVCALIPEPKSLMKWTRFSIFRRNHRLSINYLQRLNPTSTATTSPQHFTQLNNSWCFQ